MDPSTVTHRLIVSARGQMNGGMKLHHVRTGKELAQSPSSDLFRAEREHLERSLAGDIIGLHNQRHHQIGGYPSAQGEALAHRHPALSPGTLRFRVR